MSEAPRTRKTFACYTCDWEWIEGQSGDHDCLKRVVSQRDTLERELAEAKEEQEGIHKLIMRQAELLSKAAISLRGPEPELTRWSHHDIAERIDALRTERDQLQRELDEAKARIEALHRQRQEHPPCYKPYCSGWTEWSEASRKWDAERDQLRADLDKAQKWSTTCRVQFEKASAAADRFQRENLDLRRDLDKALARLAEAKETSE